MYIHAGQCKDDVEYCPCLPCTFDRNKCRTISSELSPAATPPLAASVHVRPRVRPAEHDDDQKERIKQPNSFSPVPGV